MGIVLKIRRFKLAKSVKINGKKKQIIPDVGKGGIVVYKSDDGSVKIDVRLENETVWLTQKEMAGLFHTI